MKRALQRVVRSMVGWGCLREDAVVGMYRVPEQRRVARPELAAWLSEAVLRGSGDEAMSLRGSSETWALFPFQVGLSVREALTQPGLELHREGGSNEMLLLG